MFHRIALFLTFLGLGAALQAQTPNLIHYQGRLTNPGGTPITDARQLYFTIYEGGTADTANSGTSRYSERAVVTPDVNGIFEWLIGNGTNKTGTLAPSIFNTTNPLFLQVAVGGVSNVLLPRTQITSVGYAMVAGIAAQAAWAPAAGNPRVDGVTDVTGGVVVVGDMLRVRGSGLTGAQVTIGGKPAPINPATRSDTQLEVQVPAGVPMGLNPVAVALNGSVNSSVTIAHVEVHRLLVHVAAGSSSLITIIDAYTGARVAQFVPPFTLGTDANFPTLQMAFANQGSLALIPSNGADQRLLLIDMTSNPPSLVGIINTGASRPTAVAASPDGIMVILSDTGGNRLRVAGITDAFPPYTASAVSAFGTTVQPFGFTQPRGSTFIGDGVFAVCSAPTSAEGQLFAFRRTLGTTTLNFLDTDTLDDPTNIITQVNVGDRPFAIRATPDLTRLFVTYKNFSNTAVSGYFTAPEGFSDIPPASSQIFAGSNALQVAVSPNNSTVLVADSAQDHLHVFYTLGRDILTAGDMEGPPLASGINQDYQMAVVEPVQGKVAAIGTTFGNIFLYNMSGHALSFVGAINTWNNTLHPTYELEFQP